VTTVTVADGGVMAVLRRAAAELIAMVAGGGAIERFSPGAAAANTSDPAGGRTVRLTSAVGAVAETTRELAKGEAE
jgi:hypothetical protein